MSRIDAFNPSAPSLDASARQAAMGHGGMGQGSVGQFGGQRIQLDEGPTVLSAAAEEMALYQAEKAESKRTSERKKSAVRLRQPMAEAAILDYMDAAQAYDDANELVQLARRMLSGQGNASEQACQAYEQPTQQFMALQYALQLGEREGAAGNVLDDLRDALDDLEMEHGPAIRADMHSVGTAAQGGASRQDVALFQATYRDVVLGDASVAGTLKIALERFADTDFSAGLARLVQALGKDLASAHPSRDPARLQSLAQDLLHLSVASTVLDASRALYTKIASQYGALKQTPVALMQALIGICAEKWASSTRLTTLAQQFGATGVEAQIHFLSGIMQLMRGMPLNVFVDLAQRESVFKAVQEALDVAIDREDW
jgi:type III secretion protein W